MQFHSEEEQEAFYRIVNRLVAELERAERFVWKYRHAEESQEVEELRLKLEKAIRRIKQDDLKALDDLWAWFMPVGEWDQLTRPKGTALGERIFERIRHVQDLMVRQ
jgi:hypothetical protein